MLAEYYRKRASEYDAFYADPARQADLTTLRGWLTARADGRRILEVAAGTGYWTSVAAPVAASLVATDVNAAPLAIAARRLGTNVALLQADAWRLPFAAGPFDLGMAHLWWSHLRRQDCTVFLAGFAAALQPGASLLMIDERLVPGVGAPLTRRDSDGNTFQRRWLESGERFEIVKNYPTAAELAQRVGKTCDRIEVMELRYLWALEARFLR